jgi:Protein of unknown function (DUF3592)
MRTPLIGMGVAAVLVCGWLAILRYPPAQRMNIVTWLFIAFCMIMMGGTWLLRQLRSNTWECTSAQILSCSRRYNGGHGRDYICSYLYEVDGARQGGSFIVWNPNASLDQLNAALVGRTVNVRYNPEDCSQSMIVANSIDGWKVQ